MASVFLAAWSTHAQVDWPQLERYQQTITADTFSRLLHEVYAPGGGMIPYLRYGEGEAAIYQEPSQTGAPLWVLRFAAEDTLPTRKKAGGSGGPLAGLRIALDPGHIGGAWSRIEERFFLVDRRTDWPVQEAALNLHVARLLRDRLTAQGAEVVMVKDDLEPMTPVWPDERLRQAVDLPPPDPRFGHLPEVFVESSRRDALRKQVEREFFRTDEIAARAARINEEIRPDFTLCIHFNATGWGDEKTLYEENGLAFFVHGNYQDGELVREDQKFFLLGKLLERSHAEEVALTESIARAFAAATDLPPSYRVEKGGVMHPVGTNHYIYARNLAANRQFHGPVVFLEPYFMNNRTVYARIQAGDYEGERAFDGQMMPSIFREYADAVTEGVRAFYAGADAAVKLQRADALGDGF